MNAPLLEQFRVIGKESKFTTLDANRPVHDIFADLRQHLGSILKDYAANWLKNSST